MPIFKYHNCQIRLITKIVFDYIIVFRILNAIQGMIFCISYDVHIVTHGIKHIIRIVFLWQYTFHINIKGLSSLSRLLFIKKCLLQYIMICPAQESESTVKRNVPDLYVMNFLFYTIQAKDNIINHITSQYPRSLKPLLLYSCKHQYF